MNNKNIKWLVVESIVFFFALVYTFVFIHDCILINGFVTANNTYPFDFNTTIPGVYLRPAFFWALFWFSIKSKPQQ